MSYVINQQKFRFKDTLTDDLINHKGTIVQFSEPSRRLRPFNKLLKMFDKSSVERMIINKEIIIIPCGKCKECLTLKQINYSKRVKSQLKQFKYSYLITLTFNEKLLPVMFSEKTKRLVLENNSSQLLSKYSTLSKIHIANIIKNWKNKLNRYYGEKVKVHYFLCGEYGETTQRAHYHVMLMLDRPLPNLKRELVRGNHYKSSIIDSKQYSMYDIQPTNSNSSCSSYISKYLTKSQDSQLTRYNTFMEQQLMWLKEYDENGLHKYKLFKSEKQLRKLLILWYLGDTYLLDYYARSEDLYSPTKVREFIKSSRMLGITDDYYTNIKNGVLNNYYFKKLITKYDSFSNYIRMYYFVSPNILLFKLIYRMFFYVYRYFLLLFEVVERQRFNTIVSTFYKNIKVSRNKIRKDIL